MTSSAPKRVVPLSTAPFLARMPRACYIWARARAPQFIASGPFIPAHSAQLTLLTLLLLSLMSQIGCLPVGIRAHATRRAHRRNVTPPYYSFDLPKSGLRFIVCDKPSSSKSYRNLIDVVDHFCVNVLRHKKARTFLFTSVILSWVLHTLLPPAVALRVCLYSEIAHTSDDPMEPPHMLVKFTLPSANGIAQAIPAHIYLTGSLPHAKIDTTCVFWKDAEEIAEHEILASHQAINLRLDTLSELAPRHRSCIANPAST